MFMFMWTSFVLFQPNQSKFIYFTSAKTPTVYNGLIYPLLKDQFCKREKEQNIKCNMCQQIWNILQKHILVKRYIFKKESAKKGKEKTSITFTSF